MNAVLTNPRCERCGCEASKIFGCQERSTGLCPFIEQWKRRKNVGLKIGGCLTYILISVLFSSGYRWWAFTPLVLFGLWWALTQEVQLYNERTQTRLQRTTFAGIELNYKWTPKGKLLPIYFNRGKTAVYPLSISALPVESTRYEASIELAVAVFRAALIGLLADNYIEVHQFETSIFGRWRKSPLLVNDYIIIGIKDIPPPGDIGALERQIMQTMGGWRIKSGSKDWQNGLPIYDLVHNLYYRDQSDPEGWLIERATDDAEGRGLAQFGKGFHRKEINWDAACIAQLGQEHRATQLLSQQLAEAFPKFSLALNEQISKGIKSRQDSGE